MKTKKLGKKARLPSLRALRAKLDRTFSLYIRGQAADARGMSNCVTCGVMKPWREFHAGHWIKRQFLATRYDDRNVHPQCVHCNLYRGGALIEYTLFMQKTYGQDVVDELMRLKRTTVKHTRQDLEDMIRKYTP